MKQLYDDRRVVPTRQNSSFPSHGTSWQALYASWLAVPVLRLWQRIRLDNAERYLSLALNSFGRNLMARSTWPPHADDVCVTALFTAHHHAGLHLNSMQQ